MSKQSEQEWMELWGTVEGIGRRLEKALPGGIGIRHKFDQVLGNNLGVRESLDYEPTTEGLRACLALWQDLPEATQRHVCNGWKRATPPDMAEAVNYARAGDGNADWALQVLGPSVWGDGPVSGEIGPVMFTTSGNVEVNIRYGTTKEEAVASLLDAIGMVREFWPELINDTVIDTTITAEGHRSHRATVMTRIELAPDCSKKLAVKLDSGTACATTTPRPLTPRRRINREDAKARRHKAGRKEQG